VNTCSSDVAVKRILFINPIGELGGAERALLDLLASLRQSAPALELRLLLFAPGPLEHEARQLGLQVEVLPMPARIRALGDSGLLFDHRLRRVLRLLVSLARSGWALFRFRARLGCRIRAIDPDVIHTNGIKAHLLAASASWGTAPLVWHIHDFLSERPATKILARRLRHRVSWAVAISDAVASDLRTALPKLPVTTILNAVDVHRFSPGPGDPSALDRAAGLPPGPANAVRVGLVATYARWKGHDLFLQACARVKPMFPPGFLRFYIIGGPIYATGGSQFTSGELHAMIGTLGLDGVTGLVPFQQELPWIFRSLDIVVHASRRPEPFGRSIVEAMSCGRPIIIAAAGGARELVQDKKTGLTHEPGDVVGLSECIRQLVESGEFRSQLGSQARAAAFRQFSRERLGPALLRVYGRLRFGPRSSSLEDVKRKRRSRRDPR
jgi:glycosyltransferase involved in cell wall biosynthesis